MLYLSLLNQNKQNNLSCFVRDSHNYHENVTHFYFFILECVFYFKNSEDKFPSISIDSPLAADFVEPVVSQATDCPRMTLSSVDYFETGLQTWMPFSKVAFTIIPSSSGTFSIRVIIKIFFLFFNIIFKHEASVCTLCH